MSNPPILLTLFEFTLNNIEKKDYKIINLYENHINLKDFFNLFFVGSIRDIQNINYIDDINISNVDNIKLKINNNKLFDRVLFNKFFKISEQKYLNENLDLVSLNLHIILYDFLNSCIGNQQLSSEFRVKLNKKLSRLNYLFDFNNCSNITMTSYELINILKSYENEHQINIQIPITLDFLNIDKSVKLIWNFILQIRPEP